MKKIIATLALAAAFALPAFSQQITRVAVIDLQKVYMTYDKDSYAVRAFEAEKAKVEAEIKRLGDEIKELQKKRLELQAKGDAVALKALDETLYKKAQFLADYIKVKQAELDDKAKSLAMSDAFAQNLYRTIQSVAELDGYSLVVNSRSADSVVGSVIWFSPMIDITDKVIQALLGGAAPSP